MVRPQQQTCGGLTLLLVIKQVGHWLTRAYCTKPMKKTSTSFTYDVFYNPKYCTKVVTFIRKFRGDLGLCGKNSAATWN